MIDQTRRAFIRSTAALAASSLYGCSTARKGTFECPPCGCAMDDVVFEAPGKCPDCGMVLRPRVDVDLGDKPELLPAGAGHFSLTGASGRPFIVHYFKPPSFNSNSPIVLVIPGAGRGSAEYRNVWLSAAMTSGALIAALGYPENLYDFGAYHLGGLVKDIEFTDPKVEQISQRARTITLEDANISLTLNNDARSWLFADFDLVFDHIVRAVGSTREGYDIFGHSAGGQILHRMALFQPHSKAQRIIAANSGFYTLPTFDQPMPSGLSGTVLEERGLSQAFAKQLIILLGEDDNSAMAGGTLLKTPLVNEQGEGRLQRGTYFYSLAERMALEDGAEFNWQLNIVPGVGHDFEGMAAAAAEILFQS